MPDPNDTTPPSQPDMEALAQRMFPSMAASAPVPSATSAPQPPPAAAPAAASAPTPPAPAPAGAELDSELKALREDPAYRMFGVSEAARVVPETMFDAMVGQSVEIDGQQVHFDADTAHRAVTELRTMAADLGISASDMATVQEGLSFGKSIMGDHEKTIAARESTVEMLNAEYGQQAAFAARAARELVAKNPKLATLLERTGAGDSPQVVARIAQRAVELHKAGKLTVPSPPKSGNQAAGSQGLYGASNMNP